MPDYDQTSRPYIPNAEAALLRAIYALREFRVFDLESSEYAVSFSPNGELFAIASADNAVRVWHVHTGKPHSVLRGHSDTVNHTAFSPDGSRLVTASRDKTARVWDLDMRQEIVSHVGHTGNVWSASFSPNGLLILTTSNDGTARLWDAGTGSEVASCQGRGVSFHQSAVFFSQNGSSVIVASVDDVARIWEVKTGDELGRFTGHNGAITCVDISPNGSRVVTSSQDKTARVWDLDSRKEIAILTGHEAEVESACFSPDGNLVLTSSRDGTVRLWDAGTGSQHALFEGSSNQEHGRLPKALFCPDGSKVALTFRDNVVRLRSTQNGEEYATLVGHMQTEESSRDDIRDSVRYLAFSPGGETLLTGSSDGTARLWVTSTRPAVFTTDAGENLLDAAISTDGTQLLTVSSDGMMRILDVDTGNLIVERGLFNHRAARAVFSRDGSKLVVILGDGTARMWDTVTLKQTAELNDINLTKKSCVFSREGNWLLTLSSKSTLCVWETRMGTRVADLKCDLTVNDAAIASKGNIVVYGGRDGGGAWDFRSGKVRSLHREWIDSLNISADGRLAIFGIERDATARIWELDEGNCIGTVKHEKPLMEASVINCAFSPDGKLAASFGDDSTVRVWDVANQKEIANFGLEQDYDGTVEFSHDGRQILTAMIDAASVWDTETGTQLTTLEDDKPIKSAAYSQNGDRIVVQCHGGSIQVHTTFRTTQHLVDFARKVAPRGLTHDQRDRFFLDLKPPSWYAELSKWPFHTLASQTHLLGRRHFNRSSGDELLDRLRSRIHDTNEFNHWVLEEMRAYTAAVERIHGFPSSYGFEACGHMLRSIVHFLMEANRQEVAKNLLTEYKGSPFLHPFDPGEIETIMN